MSEDSWNPDEIEKLRTGDGSLPEQPPIEILSVASFRNQAGQLRGGETAKIVHYRGRPACIAVPHPLDVWSDSSEFTAALVTIRDRYLEPPCREPAHPWLSQPPKMQTGSMEAIRRGVAQIFAHVLRNTVYVTTYYDQYQVMSLIPIPPDAPEPVVQAIGQSIQRILLSWPEFTELTEGSQEEVS